MPELAFHFKHAIVSLLVPSDDNAGGRTFSIHKVTHNILVL